MRRLFSFFAMVFSILAVIFFTLPTIQDPNLGIEFKGGYEVVYHVTDEEGAELEKLDDVAELIAGRIDIAGVKNPQVSTERTPDGQTQFIRVCVSSKDTDELNDVLSLIESDATITFTDGEGNFLMDGSVLRENDGAVLSYDNGVPIVLLNIANPTLFGEKTGSIAGKSNMIAWIGYEEANEETGYIGDFAAYMGEGTSEEQAYAAKKIIVNAGVSEAITSDTAQITGSFTAEEASKIGKLLSAGNMPYVLTRSDILKVDGAYGTDAFQKSILAGAIGLFAIIILMGIVYKIPGLIASLVLVLYTSLILITFDLIGGEYGPDSIAAIVIGLGMAVDACIILFERFADELYKGRAVKSAYEESTKKSLSSILDSNITTIIAACVLYFFGKRAVKGFATMLLITTLYNVIVMLLITRLLMFLLIKSGKLDNKKHLLGVNPKHIPDINKGETQTYFGRFHGKNFVKGSKKVLFVYLGIVFVAICVGAGFGISGATSNSGHGILNLGLDFKPGATATIQFDNVEVFNELENGQDEDDLKPIVFSKIVDLNEAGDSESKQQAKALVEYILSDGLHFTESQMPTAISISNGFDSDNQCSTLDITLTFGNIVASDESELDYLNNFEENFNSFFQVEDIENYDDYLSVSPQVSSPTMAKATVTNALLSLGIAFLLMCVYISIRFRFTYALASLVAIFFDVVTMIAVFTIFRLEISVEFVSAVLAIIGYSINDTVVVFDRIREVSKETNYGKLDEAGRFDIVNKSLQACFTRSFWTTVSTILPIFALIFLGASATLEFSIAMLIGLVSGVFSTIWIAPSFWLIIEKRHMKRLKAKAIKAAENADKKKGHEGPQELTIVGIND